jgi:TRAP-type C4-dicarboxylate transport system permease small subunit
MDSFTNIVRRLSRIGMAVGAAFLVGMMVLIVGNIFYRLAGHIIAGSYELSELMAVIVAAFALGYTALGKGHISIDILVTRLSQRTQTVLAAFTSLICLCTWAVIVWASFGILAERWLTEETSETFH